jgi:predicted nucleic acid binding AN1-type Zn finger protein
VPKSIVVGIKRGNNCAKKKTKFHRLLIEHIFKNIDENFEKWDLKTRNRILLKWLRFLISKKDFAKCKPKINL